MQKNAKTNVARLGAQILPLINSAQLEPQYCSGLSENGFNTHPESPLHWFDHLLRKMGNL